MEGDFNLLFLTEVFAKYMMNCTSEELHRNLLPTVSTTKLPISNGFDIYESLLYLCEVHQNEAINKSQRKFIIRFWHSVRDYEEIRQFLYEQSYLKMTKLLLENCTVPFCRDIVMNTIVELVEEKTNGAPNLDIMDYISEDLDLVNIITSYLRNFETILSESFLLHTILKFFTLVVSTVMFSPESPWDNHLKRERLHFENCIIFVLENISLPRDILQSILDMLLQLSGNLPDPPTDSISLLDLFDTQKLLNGLVYWTYLKFLIEYNDVSLIDWECLETWLKLMHRIKSCVFTQQFVDSANHILLVLLGRIELLHTKLYRDEIRIERIVDVSKRSYVESIISRMRQPIEDLKDTLDRYLTEEYTERTISLNVTIRFL